MIPNAGIPMAGRWGGRASRQAGARDLQLGQISSSELSKFKNLPTKQQYEIARLMEQMRYNQNNPQKFQELQRKLKTIESQVGL